MNIKRDLSNASDVMPDTSIKNMIVLHMTAGGSLPSADSTLDKSDKINVHYIIERDGLIQQRMELNNWAFHTGLRETSKRSIGIELVGWAALSYVNCKYLTWTKKEIPADEVVKVKPYNGVRFYHKLTDAQVTALRELITYIKTQQPITVIISHAKLSNQRTDYPPDYPQIQEFLT